MTQVFEYPNDIRDDKFKYRHVLISARTQDFVAGAEASFEKATNYLKEAANYIVSDPKDLVGVKANLDSHSKSSEGTAVGTIVLPLPNVFTDSQNHGWTRETGIIGSIGTNLTNATAGDILGGGKVGGIANKITGGASIDRILGSISNQTGTRKSLIDPGYFQNYTGSDPRTFSMTFDLIPRNGDEANSILMIAMKLKQWSSPTRQVGGVSILAPHWFNIKMSNPYISALSKIDRVVLSSLTLDYGADGSMQQTADGIPKYMSMSLTFQEADMTTSNEYSTVLRRS